MGFKNEMVNEDLEKVSGGTPAELPSTQLGEDAYENMFTPCDPLKPAPELPATDLCEGIFVGFPP